MNLKYFENIDGVWLDISGQPGASLEYDAETSGWVTSGGYKKYIAQITQTSTDIPVVIVLENTLGFIPDWKYDSDGVYGFDWDGDWNSDKCVFYIGANFANDNLTWVEYNGAYNITLRASKGDDNIFQTTLEIRYYN